MFDGWSFTIGLAIGTSMAIASWILLDMHYSKDKLFGKKNIPVVQYIKDDFEEKDAKL